MNIIPITYFLTLYALTNSPLFALATASWCYISLCYNSTTKKVSNDTFCFLFTPLYSHLSAIPYPAYTFRFVPFALSHAIRCLVPLLP